MKTLLPGTPPNQPAAWRNQLLTLYHGTVDTYIPAILAGVNVSLGRAGTDFGRGFYTTTMKRQARSWAWQLAQRLNRPGSIVTASWQQRLTIYDADQVSFHTPAAAAVLNGSSKRRVK